MKKGKILLSILTIIALIYGVNVNAANAVGSLNPNYGDNGIYYPNGGNDYRDHNFNINYNGQDYTAYCLDPGYHFSGNVAMTCETLGTEKYGMVWLVNNLTGNHLVDQLAVRMVAVFLSLNKDTTGYGQNIVKYLEWRDKGDVATANTFLYGKTDAARAAIEQAYQLALKAREINGSDNNGSSTNFDNINIAFEKISSKSYSDYYTATIKVSFSKNVDMNKVGFSCESCTMNITEKDIPNKEATIIIKVNKPNCAYNLVVKYADSDDTLKESALFCKSKGDSIQNLLAVIPQSESDNSSGRTVGRWGESITADNGGSYYVNYCASSCDEKTTVTKPAFCDDSGDQTMKVNSPENIKGCILKSSDEGGSTYKMMSNKYCSVYCKEDYEMTLPGAQFATSGHYFRTRNVTINGTKTCYTTSPDSESNRDVTNIDIDGFITDIINAQTDLVKAYNEYQRQVAIKNLRETATLSESVTSNCDGHKKISYTLSGIIRYTGKKISCNSTTGQCTTTNTDFAESYSATWGEKYSKDEGTKCTSYSEDGKTCLVTEDYCDDSSSSTGTEPNWDSNINNASREITNANSNVQSIIKTFSSCYNWTAQYGDCFDPIVEFNYQEQYNSDINFEKVEESKTNDVISGNASTKIDNNYTTDASILPTENIDYLSASSSGVNNGNKASNISTKSTHVYHIKKTSTATANYQNTQEFQTNYPHGTIDTVKDKDKLKYNYSYLGAVFPIAMKTDYGVYNWTLEFTLGQYMNNQCGGFGRLNKAVGTLNTNLGYVCVYVIDCPDCDYECVCPENLADGFTCVQDDIDKQVCTIIPPCDDDCDFECVGKGCNFCTEGDISCIGTSEAKYVYRTVSLTELFPNNRTAGPNWNNQKGKDATEAIEKTGDSAYITPEYSYKLTAANMKNIRDRNATLDSFVDGDGLKFEDCNGYAKLCGKSIFLDEGEKKGYFTELKRNTTWTIYPGKIDKNKGIGPAWR